jgi:hypothetical protein
MTACFSGGGVESILVSSGMVLSLLTGSGMALFHVPLNKRTAYTHIMYSVCVCVCLCVYIYIYI